MTKLAAKLQTKLNVQKDKGATAVEYGLLVALIAAVIVAVVGALGHEGQRRLHDGRRAAVI